MKNLYQWFWTPESGLVIEPAKKHRRHPAMMKSYGLVFDSERSIRGSAKTGRRAFVNYYGTLTSSQAFIEISEKQAAEVARRLGMVEYELSRWGTTVRSQRVEESN